MTFRILIVHSAKTYRSKLFNGGSWPILLKNPVLAVYEKILTPQADLVNIDTWGYRFLS
jgi:hypothetical protein